MSKKGKLKMFLILGLLTMGMGFESRGIGVEAQLACCRIPCRTDETAATPTTAVLLHVHNPSHDGIATIRTEVHRYRRCKIGSCVGEAERERLAAKIKGISNLGRKGTVYILKPF